MNSTIMLDENTFELLLEINDLYEKKNADHIDSSGKASAPNVTSLTKNSIFEGYNLDEDDIKIVAVLLDNFLEGKKDMEASTSRMLDNKSLDRIENRINQRLKKTDKSFPLEALKKEKGLSQEEELVILALLHQEIEKNNNFNREADIIGKTT